MGTWLENCPRAKFLEIMSKVFARGACPRRTQGQKRQSSPGRGGATEPRKECCLAMSHGRRYINKSSRERLLAPVSKKANSDESTGSIELKIDRNIANSVLINILG